MFGSLKSNALSLHPQSRSKHGCRVLNRKFFRKKVLEKFGGLKKSSYLCSPFPNDSRGRLKRRLIWKFFLIDRTTFFEDIEQLSFDTLFGEYFKAIPLRLSYDI